MNSFRQLGLLTIKMQVPQTGRKYYLIRIEGGVERQATFIRYMDGSGVVVFDGQHISFELDQTTWKRYWIRLMDEGYTVARHD